jgi:hypothetical protein
VVGDNVSVGLSVDVGATVGVGVGACSEVANARVGVTPTELHAVKITKNTPQKATTSFPDMASSFPNEID